MDKETKTLLITIAVSLGLLWLLKPKSNDNDKADLLDVKYKEPSTASSSGMEQKENAVIGMQAIKDAVNDGISKEELSKLRQIILQDYGVKIMANKKTGKLRAMSKDGKVVAEEE